MRALLRRLRPDPRPPEPRHERRPCHQHGNQQRSRYGGEPTYRPPLRPWHVRHRLFATRRHGLDPAEVHAFLHRVADELHLAQTALAALHEENARIKDGLRAWQTQQARTAGYELVGR